jgi:hypothetical protein
MLRDNGGIILFLDSLDSESSILNSLILVTIETVVGKELQFNRAILCHYSLLTPDFKHGDETPDTRSLFIMLSTLIAPGLASWRSNVLLSNTGTGSGRPYVRLPFVMGMALEG